MEKNEDILNKKDITEIKDPTILISKIKGVKYKNKKTNKNCIGVIAQDIRNNIQTRRSTEILGSRKVC